jgi:hypothetical protein
MILQADSAALWRPGRKPTPPIRLDGSHALAVGLTDCLVWNEGPGVPLNLGSGAPATTLTSTPTWVSTAQGIAGYSTGGSSFNIPDHGNIVAGDFAIRVLCFIQSWPANFTCLFDKGTGSGRELSTFFDTSGNIDFYGLGKSGTGGNGQGIAISTGMTAGSIWDFVETRTGSTVTWYVNGVSKGTTTQAANLKC